MLLRTGPCMSLDGSPDPIVDFSKVLRDLGKPPWLGHTLPPMPTSGFSSHKSAFPSLAIVKLGQKIGSRFSGFTWIYGEELEQALLILTRV